MPILFDNRFPILITAVVTLALILAIVDLFVSPKSPRRKTINRHLSTCMMIVGALCLLTAMLDTLSR